VNTVKPHFKDTGRKMKPKLIKSEGKCLSIHTTA